MLWKGGRGEEGKRGRGEEGKRGRGEDYKTGRREDGKVMLDGFDFRCFLTTKGTQSR